MGRHAVSEKPSPTVGALPTPRYDCYEQPLLCAVTGSSHFRSEDDQQWLDGSLDAHIPCRKLKRINTLGGSASTISHVQQKKGSAQLRSDIQARAID